MRRGLSIVKLHTRDLETLALGAMGRRCFEATDDGVGSAQTV